MKSWRRRNGLICGDAEILCSAPYRCQIVVVYARCIVIAAQYEFIRASRRVAVNSGVPPSLWETQSISIAFHSAATSCLTKINYSSRGCTVVARNIIERRLFITSWQAESDFSLCALLKYAHLSDKLWTVPRPKTIMASMLCIRVEHCCSFRESADYD